MHALLDYIRAINPGKTDMSRLIWMRALRCAVDQEVQNLVTREAINEVNGILESDDLHAQAELARKLAKENFSRWDMW